ncbi:MAG TPA: hypothetical protein DDY13_07255 [Cytophagales bacterium]|jgi:hypothetical protein|nr:hypothetical protein [Cytophagales bacterium]
MKKNETTLIRRRKHFTKEATRMIRQGKRIDEIVTQLADEYFLSKSTVYKDLANYCKDGLTS